MPVTQEVTSSSLVQIAKKMQKNFVQKEKNMAMYNIKILVATSVLYVFFNGAAIYGMENDKNVDSKNLKENVIENTQKIAKKILMRD